MSKRFLIKNEQGQTMVEFALVLPIILLILFGVIQFGIAFNHYLTVTDAVRAGARKAAVSRHDPNGQAAAVQAARKSATNLDQGKFTVSVSSTWEPGDPVTVTGSYPYSISLLGVVVTSGSLTSSATDRVE